MKLKRSAILRHFAIPDTLSYELHPLLQGLIHNTFHVTSEGRSLYILQEVNTKVFKDPEAVMGNIGKALPFLKAVDYHGLDLIPTRAGNTYLNDTDAGCWRMMRFVPGCITYNTTTDPKIAYEAGRIIGRFHALLEAANPIDFAITLPNFLDLAFRKSEFTQALSQAEGARRAKATAAIEQALQLLELPGLSTPPGGPLRVCHNDTKLNNILFSGSSGAALCLIDLDTLMGGYFLYDFGDAVRTIVNTAPEDEKDIEKIRFSKNLFEAFVQGLGRQDKLFYGAELETLANGAVYMPTLHGLRALTDFLQGDIYYQITYEGQNLDRAVSLLTFAERAHENMAYMEEVLTNHLAPRGA